MATSTIMLNGTQTILQTTSSSGTSLYIDLNSCSKIGVAVGTSDGEFCNLIMLDRQLFKTHTISSQKDSVIAKISYIDDTHVSASISDNSFSAIIIGEK